MKIHAISDIHIDFDRNARAMEQISEFDFQDDILILAGDISSHLRLIEKGFSILMRRFKQIVYVPGNHDLWVDQENCSDSMEKYRYICSLTVSSNIAMEAYQTGTLSIVPLLGWYDYSFGMPDEKMKHIWMDYHECIWPAGFDAPAITEYFLSQNKMDVPENNTVISFSHFLPRIDLMPSYIPEQYRYLYPVLGSRRIDDQIRKMGSEIHVYGHTHVNRDIKIDGIRYINNAFGYPGEERITIRALRCIHEHK